MTQNATIRRVNLLGNLNADLNTVPQGPCTNPCSSPQTLNAYEGAANGFEIANSNITGDIIDPDGENTLGNAGENSNEDLYIQDSHIGGFEGFGVDMVFSGDTGNLPANDFGPATQTRPPGDIDVIIPAEKFQGAYHVMAQGVNDIHYSPGAPRTFLGGVAWHF